MRAIRHASRSPNLLRHVERGIADAAFAAQLRNRAVGFGLLQDGDDLAVGKA